MNLRYNNEQRLLADSARGAERLRVAREQAVARRKQPAAVLRQRAATIRARIGELGPLLDCTR